MRIAVRRLDDLERHGLAHLLDLGRIELAADQAFDGVERVRRIGHRLTLGDLADEPLILIGKPDDGRRRAAAFFVRDDLHCSAFENGDTAVCRAEIDSYYFAHMFWVSSW